MQVSAPPRSGGAHSRRPNRRAIVSVRVWRLVMHYTIEQKMRGEDLHGLPCRVPKPTEQQRRCSHSETRWITEEVDDGWGGKQTEERSVEVTLFRDIPGTNNFRCTRCGYTRRY